MRFHRVCLVNLRKSDHSAAHTDEAFLRPSGISHLQESVGNKIRFQRQNGVLNIENPTQYYLSIIGVTIRNIPLDIGVLPPKSHRQIPLPPTLNTMNETISFSLINDEGNSWDYTRAIK